MNDSGKILVLNYHLLSDDQVLLRDLPDPLYTVGIGSFLEQMNLLEAKNIPVVSLDDLTNGRFNKNFGVVLTFDDGHLSDYQTVSPILKAHQFTAAFFPFIHSIGTQGRLSWEHWREFIENGFTVGSHGLSHTIFSQLSFEQQLKELRESKLVLEKNLNCGVNHFSMPYGWFSDEVKMLVKNTGYRSLLTTGLKMNFPNEKPFVIHRWNITRDTTMERFEKIISGEGTLPLEEKISSQMKSWTKKILGPALTDRLNIYLNNKQKIS